MAPRPLQVQCTKSAIRNIDKIEDIGDLPYERFRDILICITNAKQLRELELNCPQVVGLDGEIWLKIIKKDIPNWQKKPHEPKNPDNWWKVYRKLKREADEEEMAAMESLKQRVQKLKEEAAKKKVAPPTRAIPEKRGRVKGQAMPFNRGSDATGLRFTTGSKTKNMMRSARRQAAEASLQHHGVLARPQHMLSFGRTKPVIEAPRYMVEDKQFEMARQRRDASPPRPQASTSATPRPNTQAESALQSREVRLKALQSGRAAPIPRKAAETPTSRSQPPTSATSFHDRPRPTSNLESQEGRPKAVPADRSADVQRKAIDISVRRPPPTTIPAKRTAEPLGAPKRKAGPTVLMPQKRIKR